MPTVRVRVPATSANLGPGFDSFGLALQLYNEISISDGAGAAAVTVHSDDASSLPAGAENIAFSSARRLLSLIGREDAEFHLEMWNEIPLSRGRGSSAAARVGAVVAANEWARAQGWQTATTQQLLDLSHELEGHPDNAAAALLGGFTVAAVPEDDANRALAIQMPVAQFPQFLVFSPDEELATKKARGVLPATVPHTDAVFNLSRAGLLLAALASGRLELLPEAMKDRLHQNQRAALLSGWNEIKAAAESAGAYGLTLSGAGSSLLVWVAPGDDALLKRVETAVSAAAQAAGVNGKLRRLDVDTEGARVI
jgi:homoserine kinase